MSNITITELVTVFSYKGDEKPITKHTGAMAKGARGAAVFGAAIAAAGAALFAFANQNMQALKSVIMLSENSGIAAAKIQRMEYSARAFGAEAGAMEASLDSINQMIGDASFNGSEEFSRWGISIRKSNGELKDSTDIFEDLRKRFKQMNLTSSQQLTIAQGLGIDASLLNMLNATDEELAKMNAEAEKWGTLSQSQIKQAKQYNASIDSLGQGMSQLRSVMAVGLAPALTEIVNKFADFMKNNSDGIIKAFRTIGDVIGVAADIFGRMFKVLGPVLAALGGFKVLKMIFAPLRAVLTPVGLAIMAIFLAVEDLITGINGGKSVIRAFFLDFANYDITGLVDDVKDLGKAIGTWITDKVTAASDALKQFLQYIGILDEEKPKSDGRKFVMRGPSLQAMQNGTAGARSVVINQTVENTIRSTDPNKSADRIVSKTNQSMTELQATANKITSD